MLSPIGHKKAVNFKLPILVHSPGRVASKSAIFAHRGTGRWTGRKTEAYQRQLRHTLTASTLSGDDNEESLAKRLDEELRALKAKYPGGKFTFKEKDVYFDKECERYMLKDD